MENLNGKQLGSYRVIAPLGEGGMAAVYKAYQPSMDRYVALKVLPRQLAEDPEFVARFRQEAKVIANLQHPHILPVHDFGAVDGYTYIVMPLVEGGTLKDLLHGRPLPLNQIVSIISQIGDALDYAHSRGLVHRDVKPSNVLVGERDNCLLTDFGTAKIVEGAAQLTRTGGIIGTPAYMSPEQGMGKQLDGRSDIYALGVMLYEMAAGRVPFDAETPMAIVFKHINDPLPSPRTLNPDLSDELERVILKALAKEPADRFPTAQAMINALSRAAKAAASTVETGEVATVPARPPVPRPRWPIWAWPGLTAMAMLIAAAGVFAGWRLAWQPAVPASPAVGAQASGPAPGVTAATQQATQPVVIIQVTNPLPVIKSTISPEARNLRLDDCDGDLCIISRQGDTEALGLQGKYVNVWGGSWSPDGARIVFAACTVQDAASKLCYDFLYLLDRSQGGKITKLFSDAPKKWLYPVWSPSGEWIAAAGGPPSVYLIDPDNPAHRLVLAGIQVSWVEYPIAWSPDSKHLAILVYRGKFGAGVPDGVWIVDLQGNGQAVAILDSDVPLSRIGWSPDGQSVIAERQDGLVNRLDPACGGKPSGCNLSVSPVSEALPEEWLPSFYPQWAAQVNTP